MIHTTPEQRAELRLRLGSPSRVTSEKVWTYLVAHIIDSAHDQRPYFGLFCGDEPNLGGRTDLWYECQPLSPRLGTPKLDHETNSKIDLAFGAVSRRGDSGSGIAYDRAAGLGWACFVEAKHLSDCAGRTTNDPFRNQLERDIESLLCFQANGQFPDRLYFALLTSRRFRETPRTRFYGYRVTEYQQDPGLLAADIERFTVAGRTNYGQVYPDIRGRITALKISWVAYEDILEYALGQGPVDTLDPSGIAGLADRLDRLLIELDEARQLQVGRADNRTEGVR